MRLVIDTNIWVKACEMTSMECHLFISNFLQTKDDTLVIDMDHEIMKEYEDNLSKNTFYRHCIKHIQDRLEFHSSTIPNVHKRGLDKVEFHEPEDRVFLGCAFNTDKYLVTEDSDYGMSPIKEKNDEKAMIKKSI